MLATKGLPDCGGLDVDAVDRGPTRRRAGRARGVGQADRAGVGRRTPGQPAVWDNVRTAKEMLARTTSTLVHVPLLDVDAPLGREQLDEAAAPILARTVAAVPAALRTAGWHEPAAIYLAGGSSPMPAVTTVLHRALGIEPVMADQPELAVAEGSHPRPPAAVAVDPSWPDPDEPSLPPVAGGDGRGGSSGAGLAPLVGTRRRRLVAAASAVVLAVAILGVVVAQARRPDGGRPGASGTPDATARPLRPQPAASQTPSSHPASIRAWSAPGRWWPGRGSSRSTECARSCPAVRAT